MDRRHSRPRPMSTYHLGVVPRQHIDHPASTQIMPSIPKHFPYSLDRVFTLVHMVTLCPLPMLSTRLTVMCVLCHMISELCVY